MNTKISKYGIKPVERPKIPAKKKLDLRNDAGKQIVLSETKLGKPRCWMRLIHYLQ